LIKLRYPKGSHVMAVKSIGIDAGGSLLKIAYFENEKLHLKKYTYEDLASLIQWISLAAPEVRFMLTGGKSSHIESQFAQKVVQIDEFEAVINGAGYLLDIERNPAGKGCILVNIGTGTSYYYVTKNKSKRLLGSGVGGGTLMGLAKLLTATKEFQQIVSLAQKGDRSKIDLQVKDIYEPLEPPIPGHFTASNFGKGIIDKSAAKEDILASLTGMIAETSMLIAVQAAGMYNVQEIVYIGGTLAGNSLLKNYLKEATTAFNCKPNFLEKGEFSGAIGALLNN
jgi:type II pantothenate kinase